MITNLFKKEDLANGVIGWLQENGTSSARPVYAIQQLNPYCLLVSEYNKSSLEKYNMRNYGVTWRIWKAYPSEAELKTSWAKKEERTYTRDEVMKLMECVFDATTVYEFLANSNKIDYAEDSRNAFMTIAHIAWKHEEEHNFYKESDDGDYGFEIEKESYKTLVEAYGKEGESN